MLRDAWLVAEKDLRIELRSRVGVTQIVPFALTVLLLFGFALDPDRTALSRAAAGLFWVTVLLSAILAIQRSFAIETADNARDGLRLAGLDPAGVFVGKAVALVLQMLLLQVVLTAGVVVLYDVPLHGALLLGVTCLSATLGMAAAGTVYGALASGVRARETLLPLLFLPIVAPVLLGAARASEAALTGIASDGWPWVRLLAAFAVVYIALGSVMFGPLLEES